MSPRRGRGTALPLAIRSARVPAVQPDDRLGTAAAATIALAPLALVPGGAVAFVLGKLLVVAAAVLLASWAVPRGRLPRGLCLVVGAGAIVLVVAAAASSAPWAALVGRWPRYEGLVALPLYVGAAWVGARVLGPQAGERRRAAWLDALALTAVVAGLVALVELAGARPFGGVGMRPGSFQGNASELGLLGAVLLLVLLPAAWSARRAWWICGVVGATSMVAVSGSRAALLAVLVGTVLLGVLAGRGKTRPMLAASGVLIVVLSLAVPATRARLLAATTVEGRARLWSEAVDLVRASPLTGVGPSGFLDWIVPFHTRTWALEVGMQDPPDSPHLWLLQAAVAGGLPLLALAVAGVALAARAVLRAWRAQPMQAHARLVGPVAAVCAYGVALLTHFTAAGTTPLVAFLAGSAVAVAAPPQPGLSGSTRADARLHSRLGIGAWRVGAGVLAVVLVLAVGAEWATAAAIRSMNRGDVDGTRRDLVVARALRPWDVDVVVQGSQMFAALASAGAPGAADLAVTWGTTARGLVPDSMQAGIATAVGLRLADRADEAAALLDVLHERSPYDPQVLLQRGVLRSARGDLEGALDDLTEAALLDEGNPVVWEKLAQARSASGDETGAQEAAQRALVLRAG